MPLARPVKIIIAGGKTGGHLFPGIAVAQALKDQLDNVRILFVGTGTPFEHETLSAYGFAHAAIAARGMKGKGIREKLSALVRIPWSIFQAGRILFAFKPDLVLGVGGYSSGPVLMAARFMGILTAIQEQNAMPGITNRILSRVVHKIFISFKETKTLSTRPHTLHTGNPIRKTSPLPATPARGTSPCSGEKFTILITGGSQGASSINKAVSDAVALLKDKSLYTIIHQTGNADQERVDAGYQGMGVNATARAFFHDMPELQKKADLIICRAGAGTLSEITALGKPAILVPYPHAADDHQRYNALALENRGAAIMIADADLTGPRLASLIESLRENPIQRKQMARAAKSFGMPLARDAVARAIIHLISKNR